MAKAAEQEEESKKKIVELEKEISRVQEQKVRRAGYLEAVDYPLKSSILVQLWMFSILVQGALRTMTVDEYFAKNPQSKEKIDNEIRNQFWGYWSA